MSQEGRKRQEGEPLREVVQELWETLGEMTDEQRNRLRKAMLEESGAAAGSTGAVRRSRPMNRSPSPRK